MWHRHRWNPKERERKLGHPVDTPKKWGWEPMNVITGFKSEASAYVFKNLFKKDYEGMVSLKDLVNARLGYDHVKHRQEQLAKVCEEYLQQKRNEAQLVVHWRSEEEMKEYEALFPIDVEHKNTIDVRAIDQENYDPNDAEDDRNYFRMRKEQMQKLREEKMERVASELKIPVDQIEQVLHKSRVQMKSSLTARDGKPKKKAEKYITINKQ
jgi:hypothetical protein